MELTGTIVLDGILPSNEIGPPIKNGQTYTVIEEYTCGCGEVHLNVGIPSSLNFVECYLCRETLPNSNKIWWINKRRMKF